MLTQKLTSDSSPHRITSLFGIVVAGITLRWLYRGHYLEGWDAVDFALALHEFDLEKYQPHFPGYPVYIALARTTQWVAGHDTMHDTDALILPGLVFSALGVIPITLLAARWAAGCNPPPSHAPVKGEREGKLGLWAGFTSASLYLLSPGLWLQVEKSLSDALGLALLPWVLLALVVALEPETNTLRRSRVVGIAGVLMGLILGIRLSYWPFVVGCALALGVQRPAHIRTLMLWGGGGLGIGTCLWLVPLTAQTGLSELIQESVRFGTGHFTRWGGTIFSNEFGMGRYMTWWWNIWAFSLGGYWSEAPQTLWRVVFSISIGLLLLWTLLHKPLRPVLLMLGALLAPYGAWILIGQNPERPRHALPIILFLYPLAGAAVGAWMARWAGSTLRTLGPTLGTIAALCSILIAFPLVKAYSETVPPQVAFVEHVKTNFDPETTRVFTWETQRLFAYYAPKYHAARARDLGDIEETIGKSGFHGTVLFSSKLGHKLSKHYCFHYHTTFRRSKYVEPWFWTLSLFSYCGVREGSQEAFSDRRSAETPSENHANAGDALSHDTSACGASC